MLRDERDVTQDVKRDGARLTLITRTKITSTITIIADPEPRAGRHARGRLRIAALDASLRLRRRGGGSCGWHGSCPRDRRLSFSSLACLLGLCCVLCRVNIGYGYMTHPKK